MPCYGPDLDNLLKDRNYNFSKESVYHLALNLLKILEQIHQAGYTYNDLKPDNILLGHGQDLPFDCSTGNCFQNLSLHLIDFGFATRYLDKKTG